MLLEITFVVYGYHVSEDIWEVVIIAYLPKPDNQAAAILQLFWKSGHSFFSSFSIVAEDNTSENGPSDF